jgi:hypothetical protein
MTREELGNKMQVWKVEASKIPDGERKAAVLAFLRSIEEVEATYDLLKENDPDEAQRFIDWHGERMKKLCDELAEKGEMSVPPWRRQH